MLKLIFLYLTKATLTGAFDVSESSIYLEL